MGSLGVEGWGGPPPFFFCNAQVEQVAASLVLFLSSSLGC